MSTSFAAVAGQEAVARECLAVGIFIFEEAVGSVRGGGDHVIGLAGRSSTTTTLTHRDVSAWSRQAAHVRILLIVAADASVRAGKSIYSKERGENDDS